MLFFTAVKVASLAEKVSLSWWLSDDGSNGLTHRCVPVLGPLLHGSSQDSVSLSWYFLTGQQEHSRRVTVEDPGF